MFWSLRRIRFVVDCLGSKSGGMKSGKVFYSWDCKSVVTSLVLICTGLEISG